MTREVIRISPHEHWLYKYSLCLVILKICNPLIPMCTFGNFGATYFITRCNFFCLHTPFPLYKCIYRHIAVAYLTPYFKAKTLLSEVSIIGFTYVPEVKGWLFWVFFFLSENRFSIAYYHLLVFWFDIPIECVSTTELHFSFLCPYT